MCEDINVLNNLYNNNFDYVVVKLLVVVWGLLLGEYLLLPVQRSSEMKTEAPLYQALGTTERYTAAQCHSLLYTHNLTQAIIVSSNVTSPSESPYLVCL